MTGSRERTARFADVFAVREFRAIWLAELLSIAGDQLARVALSVLVFERTGSAALTALTYALTLLPALLGGSLLSGLADRIPRRRLMVALDVVRAVLVALMAVPAVPFAVLASLLFIVVLLNSPFKAAKAAMLPDILDGDSYVLGQAVRNVTYQAALVFGFAGGGALVAMVGPMRALQIDALTFAVSAVLIRLGVRERALPEPGGGVVRGSLLGSAAAGARLIWRDARLRSPTALMWLAGFYIVPEGLAVPYATQIGADATGVGLLLAGDPVGAVVGGIVLGRLIPPGQRERLTGISAVLAGVPLLGFLLEPGLAIAVGLQAASGMFAAYHIAAGAAFMRAASDETRGQVYGLASAGLTAAQGLGVALGGVLAAALGSASSAIGAAGAVGVACAVWAARGWYRTYGYGSSGTSPAIEGSG